MQMEYEYSAAMKKLMKEPGRPILKIVLVISICLVAAFGIFSYMSSIENVNAEKQNAETFNPVLANAVNVKLSNNMPFKTAYSYSSLTSQYFSDPFASNSDNTINYCIAIDAKYYPYIAAISADDMEQYQELIDYTYGDSSALTADAPAAVTMKGMPQKIDDKLGEAAVEALNIFYGQEVVDTTNYSEMIGTLYLNTTKIPEINYSTLAVCIVLTAALIFVYAKTIIPQNKYRKQHQDILDTLSDSDLLKIDQELKELSSTSYDKQNLYITANYLISKATSLDIIPINEIVHIYGCTPNAALPRKQVIIAVTGDNEKHKIAVIPSDEKGDSIAVQIVDKIKSYLPDIKYGFETGFFTKTNSDLNIDNTTPKSNLPMGILGAIIGAALGSAIWIIIGKTGFIAGIAGFVMVVFSMKGYSILAGSIDRKGQIVSICIAMLMIFAANYTSYALGIYEANDARNLSGLIDAYRKLPGLLTAANLWGSFAFDLIVGYALSILSCFRLIKYVIISEK